MTQSAATAMMTARPEGYGITGPGLGNNINPGSVVDFPEEGQERLPHAF
jgi:hypothetical protein